MLECKLKTKKTVSALFDYFNNRYRHLDEMKRKRQEAKAANPIASFESGLMARIDSYGDNDQFFWNYGNNIEEIWNKFVDNQTSNGENETSKTWINGNARH